MNERKPPTNVKIHEVTVDLGELSEAELRPAVKVGDFVDEASVLADVESDKATMELVSPAAGRVIEVAPQGRIARGVVAVRIEEIAEPLRVATLREATKVRRELEVRAAAEERARQAASTSRTVRGRPEITIRTVDVARDVDLARIDARIASLTDHAHAEAAVLLVRVARALAVAPMLELGTPMALGYVSVRGGVESRSCHSVSVDADDAQVAELTERGRPLDAVVVRFHDTVERSGHAFAHGPSSMKPLIMIVLCAPRVVPIVEPGGGMAPAMRAELSLKIGGREPVLVARLLGALAEQIATA